MKQVLNKNHSASCLLLYVTIARTPIRSPQSRCTVALCLGNFKNSKLMSFHHISSHYYVRYYRYPNILYMDEYGITMPLYFGMTIPLSNNGKWRFVLVHPRIILFDLFVFIPMNIFMFTVNICFVLTIKNKWFLCLGSFRHLGEKSHYLWVVQGGWAQGCPRNW